MLINWFSFVFFVFSHRAPRQRTRMYVLPFLYFLEQTDTLVFQFLLDALYKESYFCFAQLFSAEGGHCAMLLCPLWRCQIFRDSLILYLAGPGDSLEDFSAAWAWISFAYSKIPACKFKIKCRSGLSYEQLVLNHGTDLSYQMKVCSQSALLGVQR